MQQQIKKGDHFRYEMYLRYGFYLKLYRTIYDIFSLLFSLTAHFLRALLIAVICAMLTMTSLKVYQ